ncbi:MAG: HAD hydrolase-like protein, partial [Lachnospiraceae bacterium]|nr:HAD hydrolase-like protein [Lachnospiraceae bacterium]
IPKSETCLIGDTMFDVEGAKFAGVDCIAVTYGFGDVEEMKQAGILAVCDNLIDLPKILQNLEK